ncbi:MAG TPA: Re/Si-specific NAD(P)(+) transhydrogenase subunit alpha [Balneolaceae bacterium]|nr:Re/Si-specific NAD(P)(+) transhydrogenase subunit alpha [Balneolaceae bacterium]
MNIGVCKETAENETRVALTPEGVEKLRKDNIDIIVESGAGVLSSYTDDDYKQAGATIVQSRGDVLKKCDLLMAVRAPDEADIKKLKKEAVLVSFIWPLQNAGYVELLKEQQISALAMDTIPRISRAQSMDALSSMSNIAGYKAALLGANHLDKYFPMMMTAAGTIPPAKVLVLGAGVAGLQAIATSKRLGAVVEAFDIRPAVKEQVESLGATFVEVEMESTETESKGGYAKELDEKNKERQQEAIHRQVIKSDVVITTALIPGRPAPRLVSKIMVDDMKPGSVVVDLAAEQGGNCELTQSGKVIEHQGVQIVGLLNLPGMLAYHASKLYSKNMMSLLGLLLQDGNPVFDFEDEIISNATVTHKGEIVSPFVRENT